VLFLLKLLIIGIQFATCCADMEKDSDRADHCKPEIPTKIDQLKAKGLHTARLLDDGIYVEVKLV